MPIDFQCQCGKRYRVKDEMAGKPAKCKACGHTMRVPARSDWETEPEDDVLDIPMQEVSSFATSPPPMPTAYDTDDEDLPQPTVGGQGTWASNPARTRIDFGHYLACYPAEWIQLAVLMLVGLGAALAAWHWAPLILAGVGPWLFFENLRKQKSKLVSGDVCAAVVVSAKPYHIAVHTNLSTRHDSRDAILIMPAPLQRMSGGPPKVGQRIATVAHYYGSAQADAWQNFDPLVLACATRSARDVARVTASISESNWRKLETLLARLPDKSDGLYKLWLGTKNQYLGKATQYAMAGVIFLVIGGTIAGVVYKSKKGLPLTQAEARREKQQRAANVPEVKKSAYNSTPAPTPAPTEPPPPSPSATEPPPPEPSAPEVADSTAPPAPEPPPAPSVVNPATPRSVPRSIEEFRAQAAARRAAATQRALPRQQGPAPEPPPPPPPAPVTVPSPKRFAAGDKLEIRDRKGAWNAGRVVQVEGRRYKVHVDGSSDASDEWVGVDRLRPVGGPSPAEAPAAKAPTKPGEFNVGDKIDIHEHRTTWWAGTVLKKQGGRYFVHYDGWSDSWNEWVDADQVRPRSLKERTPGR
jgi:hypothetical protein